MNSGTIQTSADLASVYIDKDNKDQLVDYHRILKKTIVGWLNSEWEQIKNTNVRLFTGWKYHILNPICMFLFEATYHLLHYHYYLHV